MFCLPTVFKDDQGVLTCFIYSVGDNGRSLLGSSSV